MVWLLVWVEIRTWKEGRTFCPSFPSWKRTDAGGRLHFPPDLRAFQGGWRSGRTGQGPLTHKGGSGECASAGAGGSVRRGTGLGVPRFRPGGRGCGLQAVSPYSLGEIPGAVNHRAETTFSRQRRQSPPAASCRTLSRAPLGDRCQEHV